jgi:hypothetical protein
MLKSNSARAQADHQHLMRVRAMTAEVAAAISAVEHNDLGKLQVAIVNQERICNELATTKWTPSFPAKKPVRAAKPATLEIVDQIQTAYVALAQINRVYAGVVKRSKRAVDLLSALYGSQGDSYSPEPRSSESFQTLSCEV